jgi:hypothetical protein
MCARSQFAQCTQHITQCTAVHSAPLTRRAFTAARWQCGLGLADGIVDLVETGTTMRAAGLEEVRLAT